MNFIKLIALPALTLFFGIFIGRLTSPSTLSSEEENPQSLPRRTASSEATSQPSAGSLERVFTSVFSGYSSEDYASKAKLAAESSNDIDQAGLLQIIIGDWAAKDPLAALAFAKDLKRSDLLFLGLRAMGEQDFEGSMKWLQENVSDLSMHAHLMTGIFQGIAMSDPVRAVEMASEVENSFHKDQILSVTLDEWAKQDIHAVFDWLANAEISQQFPHYYDQVVTRYIHDSPSDARGLVSEMESGVDKANFALALAQKLAETDLKQAISWVETFSGQEKEFALNGLLGTWAGGENGIEALDYAMLQKDVSDRPDLISRVMMELARSAPEELEQRLTRLPSEEQVVAAEYLSRAYTVTVPEEALEWFETLDDPATRDAAIAAGMINFRHHDIEQAWSLCNDISNSDTRYREIELVIKDWARIDSAAAERALANSELINEEQKVRVLDLLRNGEQPRNEFLLPSR